MNGMIGRYLDGQVSRLVGGQVWMDGWMILCWVDSNKFFLTKPLSQLTVVQLPPSELQCS